MTRSNEELLETFYVAANRPQAVLSYATSRKLGVLTLTSTILQVDLVVSFPTMPIALIKLKIDKQITPRVCIYNKIPAALELFVSDHWDDLERRGVIEPVPVNPIWLSRVDVVPKKDGTSRIVIVMRPANRAIARKHYPMPNPDRLLTKIRNAKYFSKLDMKSEYHHILIHPASRYVKAIMTNSGASQYTRLPFGINCAPEVFQQVMDNTFGSLEGVLVYLDDVLIHALDKEMLKERLAAVLAIVKNNNLTLNERKCIWEAELVEFLGSVLLSTGCTSSAEKIDAIKNFPQPRTYAELRAFIDVVKCISRHLWNISTIMEPLRQLLTGDSHKLKGGKLLEIWGAEQDSAFEETRQ